MSDEHERHDERYEAAPIAVNRLRQLAFRSCVDPILEVARHVAGHNGPLGDRRWRLRWPHGESLESRPSCFTERPQVRR